MPGSRPATRRTQAARFHYRWPPADYYAKRALDWERPLFLTSSLMMRLTGVEVEVEVEAGQDLGALFLHCGQLVGIETQRLQNRRRDLRGFHWAGHRRRGKARI